MIDRGKIDHDADIGMTQGARDVAETRRRIGAKVGAVKLANQNAYSMEAIDFPYASAKGGPQFFTG